MSGEQRELEVWTAEDDAAYRPLRNKLMRIEARRRRDPERKTRYIPRRRKAKQ